MGNEEQVVEYFAALVDALSALSVESLTDELRILQIEGRQRSSGQLGADLSIRYGPTGPGLLGWPEHGLRRLSADEVVQWSRDWFTAKNAVLWISRPVPQSLNLEGLLTERARPHGPPPRPLVVPRSLAPSRTQFVSLSAISDQQWGILPILGIAQSRAIERLRLREGLSYSVEYTHLRIGDGRALEYLVSDGTEGSELQRLDGLTSVLNTLAESGPTEEELERWQAMRKQMQTHPQSILASLDSNAERHLLGLPTISPEEADLRLDSLSTDSLGTDLSGVLPTLFAIGPESLEGTAEGWTLHSEWSSEALEGKMYYPIEGREKGSLTVGRSGLSWALDSDRRRTVWWKDAVACFTWDTGVRTVLGTSGTSVVVAPWNWQGGSDLTSAVDFEIGPDRRIHLGEGESQYLRDRSDPSSVTDVRWLGSIVGAVHKNLRVDVVIDSDGIFVLHREYPASMAERLRELRSLDKTALLSANSRNRWLPESILTKVDLKKRPMGRINELKATVTIYIQGGDVIRFHLPLASQVQTAENEFRRLLGNRFAARKWSSRAKS